MKRANLASIGTLAVMLLSALPASSQTIRVQSGDHPGFTRLVLPIGTDREWELNEQGDGQWQLSLSPAIDGFDTSTAFNLIQRTRLSDLTATDTLALDLACACDVSSFRYDARFLVIDISDPDPNATLPEIPDTETAARAAAASALPDLANLLRSPGTLPQITQLPSAAQQLPQAADAPNPRLAEAAQIMAEQLARAAASGLLDAALNEPMTMGDPTEAVEPTAVEQTEVTDPTTREQPDPTVEQPPTPQPNEADFPTGPLPIRAETAFDTVLQLELPIGPPRENASCDGVPFNAADWSDDGGLNQGLGALRRDLFDERDVLTVDGTLALAQHYLFYGFGAEATYWLEQLQDPPENLLFVAALLDGVETVPFLPVEETEECSPGELLWRYMAGSVTQPLETDDTAALQRAFGSLPAGLRDHMGPRLAMRLADEGYVGTARNIRDVLHRGGRIEATTLRLLDLDLGIPLDTAPAQTQQALAEALRDDGGDPVNVLAHALAFDRHVGALPTPSRLITADALIREIGDGPETDDLWRETLLGHAALGQIDEAINRLGDPARSNAARAEALTELIAERVEVGDTAALVVLAYSYGRNWRPEGSVAGRIQVRAIAALREDGLFEAAQILRDVRRPLILPAPDTPVARADDDAAVAWAQSDWTRLAQTGAGTHAAIATRLAQLQQAAPTGPAASGPPDLNALNDAVSDSRALRSAIADLLAQPTLP